MTEALSNKADNRFHPKRKSVDDAFERMFGYEWGTSFAIDEDEDRATLGADQLIQIFGMTRAARILGSRGVRKRRKVEAPTKSFESLLDYKNIPLPPTEETQRTETKFFAGQVVQVQVKAKAQIQIQAKEKANTDDQNKKKTGGSTQIDDVLAQLAGPAKMSTVQKTSDDWESFKKTDKQLQDDLEKKAQGKDAYLVKQDFLTRVDNRKFELEKEKRERERAQRATSQGN